MASQAGFRPEPVTALTPEVIAERSRESQLLLVSGGNGTDFRFVYSVILFDVMGQPVEADIDAENENLIHHHYANPSGCTHPPNASIAAIGGAENPSIPGVRNLVANTPGAQPGFPYDGVWPGCTPWTACGVIQQTNDPQFKCNLSDSPSYTVFPVVNSAGTAVYQNADPWRGLVATDALYFTKQTWDGLASINPNYNNASYFPDAKYVVIESSYAGTTDNAYFAQFASSLNPANSVVINPRFRLTYTWAAVLDVVAHEWGHDVETTMAHWPLSGVGAQLQEGFADVIGQAVEKNRQPFCCGVETSADWDVGEDVLGGGYLRSGSNNDGDSGHFLPTGAFVNNMWHRLDTANPTGDPHYAGNVANVLFNLLAVGGQNSVCLAHATFDGCNLTLTGIGVSKASRILVDAVFFYSYPSENWNDVATMACVAAHDDYSGVSPSCAAFEQDQVMKAFAAVGYPATVGPTGPPFVGC